MATKYYTLSGKIRNAWLKNPDATFGDYTCFFYPDEASWPVFHESGGQAQPKTDEHGTYIRLRRKHAQKIGIKSVEFGPPIIQLADGTPFTGIITNDSTANVDVEVYDTKRAGKGMRLNKVTITNLIPWVPKEEKQETADLPPVD